jgi:hypothetical protein
MKLLPRWLVVVMGVALIATPGPGAAGHAMAAQPTCIDVSHGIPLHEMVAPGSRARVAPGALVFVVLVEPAAYTGGPYPSVFPWLPSRSSNRRVLRPVPICPDRGGASTLPVRDAAFRAVQHGRATLTAPLSSAWRTTSKRPFTPYRAAVIVTSTPK